MNNNEYIIKLEELCNEQGYALVEVSEFFVVIQDKYGERVKLQKEFFKTILSNRLY